LRGAGNRIPRNRDRRRIIWLCFRNCGRPLMPHHPQGSGFVAGEDCGPTVDLIGSGASASGLPTINGSAISRLEQTVYVLAGDLRLGTKPLTHSIENLSIALLRPWPRNARTHSRKQIRQIAESISRFGFTSPVLIDGRTTSWPDTAGSRRRENLASRPCHASGSIT
jgi:hypothetical protein